MPSIPEFVLRKLFVPNSLIPTSTGFTFDLNNNFAPGSLTGFSLDVDGEPVPTESLTVQAEGNIPRSALKLAPDSPYPLPVSTLVHVRVQGMPLPQDQLTLHVVTREAGEISFTIKPKIAQNSRAGQPERNPTRPLTGSLGKLFTRPLVFTAQVSADAGAEIGNIAPFVYGQFIEHLENCVYGGIWTEDGSRLRDDVVSYIKALKPPVIRYPGGNFASAYHWEDGVGRKDSRPPRFDKAWNTWDTNQVGTDEFMQLCAQVGAQPYLVVNDGSGTPEEAARWVSYCNHDPDVSLGKQRAANGHAAPYCVQLWGVGNEVWGEWQIGHTGAQEYAERLRVFAEDMRFTDPGIAIVAVGAAVMSDAPDDPGRQWNEIVLREAGDLIDGLSFHIYQPGQEGWLEQYDPTQLHYAICAAPLDLETLIERFEAQIKSVTPIHGPAREIGVVLDEWNLWLTPVEGARSMHDQRYAMRDALYVAGALNAFQRQCKSLAVANLAQLVNVLPLIVTNGKRAFVTPMYYPFLLYRNMERVALQTKVEGPCFDSPAIGNISARQGVPYIDASVTKAGDGRRAAAALINRHPAQKARVTLTLTGFDGLAPRHCWVLSAPDPLATNTPDAPDKVRPVELPVPAVKNGSLEIELPATSLAVITFS